MGRGSRKQRSLYVIEEQRYSDHARDLDEPYGEVRCKTQPAANEELGECCRDYDQQKKATGNPCLERRRRFSNPLQHFMASRWTQGINLAITNGCSSSGSRKGGLNNGLTWPIAATALCRARVARRTAKAFQSRVDSDLTSG
jgi:hypothetical protein